MIEQDERKQIILHLYKLIKESEMFSDYPDVKIKEAAIKSEQKVFENSGNKDDYLKSMKSKFDKVIRKKKETEVRAEIQSPMRIQNDFKIQNIALDRYIVNPDLNNKDYIFRKESANSRPSQVGKMENIKTTNNIRPQNMQSNHFNNSDNKIYQRSDISNVTPNNLMHETNQYFRPDNFGRQDPSIRSDNKRSDLLNYGRTKSVNYNRLDNIYYQNLHNRDYNHNISYFNNRDGIQNIKERSKSMNRYPDDTSLNMGFNSSSYTNYINNNQIVNPQLSRINVQFLNQDPQFMNESHESYKRNNVKNYSHFYVNENNTKPEFGGIEQNPHFINQRHNYNTGMRRDNLNFVSKTPDVNVRGGNTNNYNNIRHPGSYGQNPDVIRSHQVSMGDSFLNKQNIDSMIKEPVIGRYQQQKDLNLQNTTNFSQIDNKKRDIQYQKDFFRGKDMFDIQNDQNLALNITGVNKISSPSISNNLFGSDIVNPQINLPFDLNRVALPKSSTSVPPTFIHPLFQRQNNNYSSQYDYFKGNNNNFEEFIERSQNLSHSSKEPKKTIYQCNEELKSTKKSKTAKKLKKENFNKLIRPSVLQKTQEPIYIQNKEQDIDRSYSDLKIIKDSTNVNNIIYSDLIINQSPSGNESPLIDNSPACNKNLYKFFDKNLDLNKFISSTTKLILSIEDQALLKKSLDSGEEIQMKCMDLYKKYNLSYQKFEEYVQKLDIQRKLLEIQFFFMTHREVDKINDLINQYYFDSMNEILKIENIQFVKYDDKLETILSVYSSKKKQNGDWVLNLFDE